MLGTVRFLMAMIIFLIIYITLLAPALDTAVTALAGQHPENAAFGGYAAVETALFVGMPLVMVGGIILVGFIVAFGLRGTSFR